MKRTCWIVLGLGLVACGSDDAPGSPDAEVVAVDAGPDACTTPQPITASRTPLSLYLMLDQSASMADAVSGGTKWSQVGAAIEAFAGEASLGLQYFGLDSCTAATYGVADVEIASGALAAITASLASHAPSTTAQLSAAVQGAVDHAQTWRVQHAGEQVAAVVITDGVATDCDTDLSHIAAIAAAAAGSVTTPVRTYVIAIGAGLGALDPIAAAGDTGAARAIDTTGNTAAQVSDTLQAIRAEASCGVAPPPIADLEGFDVELDDVPVPHVANAAACTGAGWYDEVAGSPSLFSFCPDTCADVLADDPAITLLRSCE